MPEDLLERELWAVEKMIDYLAVRFGVEPKVIEKNYDIYDYLQYANWDKYKNYCEWIQTK